MGENDNRTAEQVRPAAVVFEPTIEVANRFLDVVRDARKRLGRDAKAVWMPPSAYCVRLLTASLPPRALDEVIGMGLPAGVAGRREFKLRLDPPSLERQGDGSMLVVSRAWTDDPSFDAMAQAVVGALESVGVEALPEDRAGLMVVFGWVPGPCQLTAIPGTPTVQPPDEMLVKALVAGMLVPVDGTPMLVCHRIRTAYFEVQ